jgi:predicted nucleic acid-binding protein
LDVSPLVVVLDANALVPAVVRDSLLSAARAGPYRVRWSEAILAEVRGALLRLRPTRMSDEQADRLIATMTAAFPDAAVRSYAGLIDAMQNDPKDRHVLAAAVQIGARVIVTLNLKDFPQSALGHFDIEA